MKTLLVGDNSTYLNWGGRGAGIALYQLLSRKFDIVGVITGDNFVLSTAKAGYVNTLMPAKYNWIFLRMLFNVRKRRVFDWYIKIEKLFGARDFISEDPRKSIDNLIRYKDQYPELSKIYEQAKTSDVLLVNGEGDMVFSRPPRRETLFLLAMVELGVRLNKKVAFINSMISDCPTTGRNVNTLVAARSMLSKCTAVLLRDAQSLRYVEEEMPGVNASYVADSLFSWFPFYQEDGGSNLPINGDFIIPFPERKEFFGKLDFSEPYICIGGSALSSNHPKEAVLCYGKLVDSLRGLGYRIYLTENDVPDNFLREVAGIKNVGIVPVETAILACGAILANARLFISGRYHPSIFASLGGTPCIFLGSTAHKMRSLQEVLEYSYIREFPAFPSDAEISEIVSLARRYLEEGEERRVTIRAVAKRRYEETLRLPDIVFDQITSGE